MPLALELTGVDFAYGQGPQVLKDVDLRVEQGEFVAIAGPNGGGKTTLLRIALGLERPTRGAVFAVRRARTELPRADEHRLPRAADEDRPARAGDRA